MHSVGPMALFVSPAEAADCGEPSLAVASYFSPIEEPPPFYQMTGTLATGFMSSELKRSRVLRILMESVRPGGEVHVCP
jgi:hypothetical protein